jgi:tetratricopeptide (TPR) repeat protein
MQRYVLAFLLCLFAGGNVIHASEQGLIYFNQANQVYEEGDYSGANELYEKAVNEGLKSAAVYYNYANTLFRLKKLGKAILYYERALKLSPTDEDIQANLKFAYAQTVDKHPVPEYNALTKFIWGVHAGYNLTIALWIVLGLFTIIFILCVILLFLPPQAKLLFYPIIVLIGLFVIATSPSIGMRIYELEATRFAIVLSKNLDIFSGPGEGYQVLSKVHEGTKFEIKELAKGWAKVKLPNGTGGYVKFSELGKI